MDKYIVRNAVKEDIPAIENIFAAARKFMFSCRSGRTVFPTINS